VLELPEMEPLLIGFDEAALLHRWRHPDPQVDALATEVLRLVNAEQKSARRETFNKVWQLVHGSAPPENYDLIPRAAIPYMDEPWYC
jgi:hypothetical protein